MLIQIINNTGMVSKDIVNNVHPFNDGTVINNLVKDDTRMNIVSCE